MTGVPCVWISVPLWKGAPSGLNEMIRRESAPCRHFDSGAVAAKITRQADHVHPDAKAAPSGPTPSGPGSRRTATTSKGFWASSPRRPTKHGPAKPAGGS